MNDGACRDPLGNTQLVSCRYVKLFVLNTAWTPLVVVNDHYSHLVYPSIMREKKICENFDSLVIEVPRK